jgi:type I restriction enzyme R subunit
MSTIGQVERKTQRRVVKLFRDTLGYAYLGDWTDRIGNRNVDEDLCEGRPGPPGIDRS